MRPTATLLLIAIPVLLNAQSILWSKTISEFDEGMEIHSTDEGHLVAARTHGNERVYPEVFLLKYSRDWELQWKTQIGGRRWDAPQNPVKKILVDEGGIFVFGNRDLCGFPLRGFAAIRYDSTGLPKWYRYKKYIDSHNVIPDTLSPILKNGRVQSACFGPNGNLVLVGEVHRKRDTSCVARGWCFDAWILKMNREGDIIWGDIYGEETHEGLHDVTTDEDGNIIAAGYYEKAHDKGYFTRYGLLLAMNENGEMKWKRKAQKPSKFHKVIRGDDGESIIGGISETGGYKEKMLLMGIDQKGKRRWRKTYLDTGKRMEMRSLKKTGNGGLIFSGKMDTLEEWSMGARILSGFGVIGYVGRDRKLRWKRSFEGEYRYSAINGIAVRDSGEFLMTGRKEDEQSEMWLLRISDGR